MEKDVCASEDGRRVALRVSAEELNPIGDAELVGNAPESRVRLGGRRRKGEVTRNEQARIGKLHERGERCFDSVALVLITPEQEGQGTIRPRCGREHRRVDRVVKNVEWALTLSRQNSL